MKRAVLAYLGLLLLFCADVYALVMLMMTRNEWWAIIFPAATVVAFIVGRKSHKYCTSVDLENLRDDLQATDIAAARATDGKLYDIERKIKADSDRCFQRYIGTAKLHDELNKRTAQLEATIGLLRARIEQELKPAPRTRRPKRGE